MISRALRCCAIVAMLSLLSCTDETVFLSSGDSLVDPRVDPRVVFTYPPMNSFGPYPEWDRNEFPFSSDRVELRFNKLMDPVSVKRALRLTSSMRLVTLDSSMVSDSDRDVYWFYPRLESYVGGKYAFGEVFTLSLSQTVYDVNGKPVAAGDLGTFVPESYCRARLVFPSDGTVLPLYNGTSFRIAFNSKIDSAVFPFVTITPPLDGAMIIFGDSMTLHFSVYGALPAQEYALTVNAGAPDKQGHRSQVPFSARYRSLPFELRERYRSDSQAVELYRSYALYYSYPVDPTSALSAVRIAPALEGGLDVSVSGTRVIVSPRLEYDPLTRYVITVDSTLRSTGGERIPAAYAFAFTTAEFGITGTEPYSGNIGVSRTYQPALYFNANLDTSTMRAAFTIVPETAGSLLVTSPPSILRFQPSDTLNANQPYRITVDTALRTRRGVWLSAPYSFVFTTGNQ